MHLSRYDTELGGTTGEQTMDIYDDDFTNHLGRDRTALITYIRIILVIYSAYSLFDWAVVLTV